MQGPTWAARTSLALPPSLTRFAIPPKTHLTSALQTDFAISLTAPEHRWRRPPPAARRYVALARFAATDHAHQRLFAPLHDSRRHTRRGMPGRSWITAKSHQTRNAWPQLNHSEIHSEFAVPHTAERVLSPSNTELRLPCLPVFCCFYSVPQCVSCYALSLKPLINLPGHDRLPQ